ncbi:MAG: energy-coupling factor transporter transmembrane component T [Verrucomicrobiota bacterium]
MSAAILGHQHRRPDSPVHRLSPGPKLAVAVVILAGTVTLPLDWKGWFLGVPLMLGITIAFSRISPWFLLKRLLLLSPFVLGVAVLNAFQPGARGSWLGVAVRSGLCLLTVLLVSNTTPFSGILRTLRTVRVPALLITTLALMYRYLFVLAEESERMRRARASRTFTTGRRFHWQTLSTVISQLFIRASERAEHIYDAMCARGWR